ncbi:follistatin-related protein 5-like isoform X2 [Neocloeon triangulifer]|uniref:follistatin-related protein 5-like isoform X2 n=1 Tax=Neocloeon triangulifer TaxID=2078957 RepID=UPI00286F074D|nr:follistatin-related protein 5-like isoform X2 [Neocloeon triangulifer]
MRRPSQLSLLLLGSLLLSSVTLASAKRSRHHREQQPYSENLVNHPAALLNHHAVGPSQNNDAADDDVDDGCSRKYCGKGRECQLDDDGQPQCVCMSSCPRHHEHIVCGTDGELYHSHCELHRVACVEKRQLSVDRGMTCLKNPKPHNTDRVPSSTSNTTPTAPSTTPSLSTPNKNGPSDECSFQEYEIMKDNLLLFNHARLMADDKRSSGKEYLVSIMFSHYDSNNDGTLELEELQQIAAAEQLEQLSKGCNLADMIAFDDVDKDARLNINEFYLAFSVSVVSLDKALEVNHVSARVGDNVEIKCDVTGTPPPPIVWRRNEVDLLGLGAEDEDAVRVFTDGSLYLTRIQLLHAGNYTCHAQRNRDVVQTHVLTVHTVPEVKVTPRIQSRRPGEDAAMLCHVVGQPFPKVEWLKNDEPLRMEAGKYEMVGNGTELRVRHITYADTGAYMCQASSVGGLTRDISSLVVQDEPSPTAPSEERRFFSFHDWGVSVYEPTACRLYHQIQATDIIPGTQEYVCGDKGVNCSWGHAINVDNRYVFVTQPLRDRVLVISKIQMVVVDVVVTDKYPVELYYVPHLDQVWVLNWRSLNPSEGVRTIQVIRDASQKKKHHTVHPEPIDGQFDLVKGLFIPPVQDIRHNFKYGYVTHTDQRGMYKLDLANMRYTRSLDFNAYNCVPSHVAFSALYGLVIVSCKEPMTDRPNGQMLVDYLTDSVISFKSELPGQPKVSPDSRVVVTLDRAPEGVTLVVQEITETGLQFLFDVKTTLNISDIAFYPSRTTHGYDLYASATDKEDLLFLNLVTGKVEMITGVGHAMVASLAQWGNTNRPIVSSGVFGHFMVSPANEALFVVNGETRTVNCEIGGLVHPRSVVWVTMQLQ